MSLHFGCMAEDEMDQRGCRGPGLRVRQPGAVHDLDHGLQRLTGARPERVAGRHQFRSVTVGQQRRPERAAQTGQIGLPIP